ncbi:hypothetical protein THAOC_20587 [Thalassiosira oceanica]|uniref:Uncharacterized protein n=1 Tax=Thalassiosira oceanica TaxID=159749 RepID=K0SE76_THAOC|nr:hypothetical protein THAOC_20587 [Thalassiosira oceanica]|eukprot:EJK59221.1 hypothetical protein THAOC_20587 [Thalassiosira oceanica]
MEQQLFLFRAHVCPSREHHLLLLATCDKSKLCPLPQADECWILGEELAQLCLNTFALSHHPVPSITTPTGATSSPY